jgi:hypothetical protein
MLDPRRCISPDLSPKSKGAQEKAIKTACADVVSPADVNLSLIR